MQPGAVAGSRPAVPPEDIGLQRLRLAMNGEGGGPLSFSSSAGRQAFAAALRRTPAEIVPTLRRNKETKLMSDTLRHDALEYHRLPTPGKISVTPTKPMATQRDLALAYSPGVAEACVAIVEDPREAGNLTARGNLVAVVTNGTAVLGLGDIGALAGKPVMEGKGCLFKKFAGIDVFDIELDERTRTS